MDGLEERTLMCTNILVKIVVFLLFYISIRGKIRFPKSVDPDILLLKLKKESTGK